MLLHPELPDCDSCRKFVTLQDWSFHRKPDGSPTKRGRKALPPCGYPNPAVMEDRKTVCPKISPAAGVVLSAKNWQAYNYYRECRAVGAFPDDPVVRQNAAIIRGAEDEAARFEQKKNMIDVAKLIVDATQ